MNNIFVRFKSPIAAILLLVLLGGIFSYLNLKTSLFPDVTFPKIKIIAQNGEQPVQKMMVTVTKPLEEAIKSTENIQLIRSTTSMGSCEISAFMKWNSDIDQDKQQVESRIAQIKNNLPPDVQISVEKMNPSILPVMGYSLQSDTKSPMELRMIAEYTIKPFLSRIAGVSSVQIIGGKVKEYRIVLNQSKLSTLKLGVQEIQTALQQTNFIKSTGYTVDYNRLYLTVTDATIKNKEQLENLIVFDNSLRKIRLADIAKIDIAERTEYLKIKADGKDVPLIAIVKQPGSNLMEVAGQVESKVAELNQLLPKGVQLKPYYNQSEFVGKSIKSIIDVLWIGLTLAIIVVLLFLRSAKAGSVILLTIPLTLALTFIILYSIGFDFNIMTIGAIAAAIGLIIDDAIIVVEQIHRTHEEHPDCQPKDLVGKAIRFLLPSMIGSSLSTIVILIPFELMSGVAGAYFRILTQTMIITLLCSFVITWLGLPVVYLLLSRKKEMPKSVIEMHRPVQHRWLGFIIAKPWISLIFVGLLVISAIVIMPDLKAGFLPEMDEGSIVLDYNSPPGTSLEETNRMLNKVDNILEHTPEVKAYSRRTGTQMGFFITEPNRGDYLIELKDNRNKTTDEVADDIRQKIEGSLPGLTVDFGQVVMDMLGDLMSSVQPVEIKIFGDDHLKLQALSKQIADTISTVPGTADVFDGIVIAGPMVSFLPRESKLKQYGLNAADLQSQVECNLVGQVVGTIPEKEQLTDIRMMFPWQDHSTIAKMGAMKIATQPGNYVELRQVADVSIQPGVAEIERENQQTMGVVTARLNNRDLGSTMSDIQKKVATIGLPASYQVVYGGAYADQQKSFSELLKVLILATLLVYIVILFMFRNIKLALIVIITSILGVVGGILALYFTGMPLNVGSYTGLIMIVGIIGENCIFTIQQFLTALKDSTPREAIVYAISTRLRPKLMTASAAIIALIPLALGIGSGAQMHQSLAIAVIGGLIMALPLLLIILPGFIYLVFNNTSNSSKY